MEHAEKVFTQLDDIANTIGPVIDRLVANFSGVNVLLLSADDRNRRTLSRLVRSIISTAEVVEATDAGVAENILDSDIDLVIIPTHGRTGIGHFLFGSVAERVVRTCPCPVLTMRPE